MGSSAAPTPLIWKKWSITQRLAKPASSAVLPISASLGPIPSVPSGQVKLGTCNPMSTSVSPLALATSDRQILSPGARPGRKPSRYRPLIDHAVQDLEEPFDVLCGVVEVRRDAHALAAHADEDALSGEPGGEVFRDPSAEAEPDHVPRPTLCRDRLEPALLCLHLDEVRQGPDGLGDVLDAPLQELAQRLARHREQDEVAPLADVVAPGAGLEGVLVVHEL